MSFDAAESASDRTALSPEQLREVQGHLNGLAERFPDLSDAMIWPEDPWAVMPEPAPEPRDDGHGSWPDAGAQPRVPAPGWINAFPATAYGSCTPGFVLTLPSAMGPHPARPAEREAAAHRFSAAAVRAVDHWASVCKGKSLIICTDAWPLPAVPVPLTAATGAVLRREGMPEKEVREFMQEWHRYGYDIDYIWHSPLRRHMRRRPGSWDAGWFVAQTLPMNRALQLCAEAHGLQVHPHLHAGGRSTALPSFDARRPHPQHRW